MLSWLGLPVLPALAPFQSPAALAFWLWTSVTVHSATAAAGWLSGVPAADPFKRPYLSTSLADFWRLWNAIPIRRGFRPLIYDPICSATAAGQAGRTGQPPTWRRWLAVCAVFAASGAGHELSLMHLTHRFTGERAKSAQSAGQQPPAGPRSACPFGMRPQDVATASSSLPRHARPVLPNMFAVHPPLSQAAGCSSSACKARCWWQRPGRTRWLARRTCACHAVPLCAVRSRWARYTSWRIACSSPSWWRVECLPASWSSCGLRGCWAACAVEGQRPGPLGSERASGTCAQRREFVQRC